MSSLESIEAFVQSIESQFGPYKTRPNATLVPDLYKKSGAWGITTYTGTTPLRIEVDENLFIYNPALAQKVTVHELLEWKAVERGETYPHWFSEKNTPEILKMANIRPLDVILENWPRIRNAVFILAGR